MPSKMDRSKVVVILEDDQYIRGLLAQILQDKGYYVVPVETGLRALQVLQQVRARLLVMDLMLPDMPGNQVLQALRADEKTKDVPVMVLSSHLHMLQDGSGYEADQVIGKPFDVSDVVDEVERLVGRPFTEEPSINFGGMLVKGFALG